MMIVALLSGSTGPLLMPVTVAGVELTEWQVRQVRRAGAARVFVIGGGRYYAGGAVNLDNAAMLCPRLADADMVLVLAAGLVVDCRVIKAVLAAARALLDRSAPVVATWPVAAQRGIERIDALTNAAGVAVYPVTLVQRIALQLGDWDLHSTLLRAALGEPGCARVDLATLPDEAEQTAAAARPAKSSERQSPLIYLSATARDEAAAATTAILNATALPRSDAVGRYLKPPVERAILTLLAPTRVTPHAITAVAGAAGMAATVAFGSGWLWAGLALAILFGPLQDLGERLARTRLVGVNWRRWHIFVVLIGYSWWLALAGHLVLARGNGGPLAVAALLLLAQLTAASEIRFPARLAALHIALASTVDHRIALLAATRDSLALLLVPFAVAGQWYAGLIALAMYATGSFAVTHTRFLQRLQQA